MYADLGDTVPSVSAPRAHLLAMLTAGMDNVTVDFKHEAIAYKGLAYPFGMFGLNDDKKPGNYTGYNVTYNVKGTYKSSDGKFN